MGKPHKHAEIIKAWADGAEIECRPYKNHHWYETSLPTWGDNIEYRIKEARVLKPFSFEDAERILGIGIRSKNGGRFLKITAVVSGFQKPVMAGHLLLSFRELLDEYTFLDGSPFGKTES